MKKIQEFKNEIGKNKKTLYFEYNEINELNQFLRIHIPLRINDLKNNQQKLTETTEISTEPKIVLAEIIRM